LQLAEATVNPRLHAPDSSVDVGEAHERMAELSSRLKPVGCRPTAFGAFATKPPEAWR
jgi:hypothetical protein